MIDFARLKIGTVFYCVDQQSQYFSRHKITMVDAAGMEWFRYDKPLYTFSMIEYICVGTVIKIANGTVHNSTDQEDEFHVECTDGTKADYYYENDNFFTCCFLTREEAQQYIDVTQAELDND